MNKETNINFKEIFDYIRDKDYEIEHLRGINLKYFKEIGRLNNIINEVANDILKELNENKHLSYGVALKIRQKLLNYQELKEGK